MPAPPGLEAQINAFPASVDRIVLVEQIRLARTSGELVGAFVTGSPEERATALVHVAFTELTLGLESLTITFEAAGKASAEDAAAVLSHVEVELDLDLGLCQPGDEGPHIDPSTAFRRSW